MTLWSLVFVRAALPVDYSLPVSARTWLAQWLPDLFGFAELRLRLNGLGYAVSSPPVVEGLPHLTWQMLIVAIWFVAAAAMLARLALSRRYYWRLVARAPLARDPRIHAVAGVWVARLGIRRAVRIHVGDAAVSPFTIGVIRPRVYLPVRLLREATPAQVDAVLGHELAHVRRYDDLWIRLQRVIVAMLCFFPPIHYASRQLTRHREVVCDQIAVSRGQLSARTYGESLLKVISAGIERRRHPVMAALVGDAEFCSVRIAAIADAARNGVRAVFVSVLLAMSAMLFLMPLGPHGDVAAAQDRLMQARASQAITGPPPRFSLPIEGAALGRRFEAIPRAEQVSYGYHTGVDLFAPVGTEVRAMADGVVERVRATPRDSLSARTGGYLIVRHGDYQAFYTYLRGIRPQEGDRVFAGELLGTLGPVPYSPEGKSSHLHLEIARDGVSVDPLLLLDLPPAVVAR
jgi:beta-lactamase regulating signal transducer with metallopeptidase domain